MFTVSESSRRGSASVVLLLLFAGLALVLKPGLAMAGQDAAASIIGQVRDESGGILPGVTVTATSPALQVPSVVSVTDERGEYRLTPLPIGTYQVDYTLSGFQSIRQDAVRLTTGFVAKLDVQMKVGALTETITVSGAAPVVDVTATTTKTQLTRETLDLSSNSGSFGYLSLVAQAPGARATTGSGGALDVGGSAFEGTAGSAFSFRVFGQVAESWQTIEGVATNSSKLSTQSGNAVDYNSVEEASVETVGANANMRSPGIAVNTIVKSGGNEFHGMGIVTGTNSRLESDNLGDLAAFGLTGHSLINRLLVGGDVGGRIIKNKLWFYGGANYRTNTFYLLGVFMPDGSVAQNYRKQDFETLKVSYQITAQHRLIGFIQPNYLTGLQGLSRTFPWDTRVLQTCKGDPCRSGMPMKAEWQSVIGSSLVFSAQFGRWNWNSLKIAQEPAPSSVDLFTQVNHGADWQRHLQQQDEHNYHTTANLSWYRPGLFKGNHEFKTGFDYLKGAIADIREPRGAAADYQLIFNNGVPFEIATNNYPVSSTMSVHYLGVYGQDKWTIGRRLTLSLGLRYAHDNGFVPRQCREAGLYASAECFPEVQFKIWNVFAPRLNAAFDVTGNGRTVIKGGWGRFDHERRIDPEVIGANRSIPIGTTWLWHDLNGNKLYEPGEVNLNPNGVDFVGVGTLGSTATGTSFAVANPNEQEPKQDQYSVSLERELMPNFGIRATGVYVRAFNNYRNQNNYRPYETYNIPITRPDPGPDGRVGTADDTGKNFTYYEYPVSLQGAQFVQGMLINPPNMDSTYRSMEFAAAKRLSNRWTLQASYSATKRNVPVVGDLAPAAYNPNAEINSADRTWEWVGRISGAYFLPAEVVVSANYQNLSGIPIARTVLFTGGRTIPSMALNVEEIGERRLPTVNQLDFRVEKRIKLAGAQHLAVRVNLYNAFNANTVTITEVRSGPAFGVPTAFMPGRVVDFGATYTF